MKKSTITLASIVLLAAMMLSACSGMSVQIPGISSNVPVVKANAEQTTNNQAAPATAQVVPGNELLAAYQQTLEKVYETVNPSVVNIRVVQKASDLGIDLNQLPELPFFNNPDGNDQQLPTPEIQPYSQGLGSGFVWDQEGHIVTNNHVVNGADKIEVRFDDSRILLAKLVGADPDSDLAVIQVEDTSNLPNPVQIADSDQVKVGQLAIAIGNPFGLEGTMTVGIVSALGRSLPANEGLDGSATYSIPDIIQTDAPINPGNSGGVLLNSNGQVIGVTAAIESPVRANAGVGFVIPSSIVQKVVPVLIQDGKYQHSWIGISGMDLTPDLAKAMNLDANQRGVLVESVMQNSPAEKAGLNSSSQEVQIDGQNINVGGDVIVEIDNQPINEMSDLIAYLASKTSVGQTISLTLLRNGQQTNADLTLEARPEQNEQAAEIVTPNQTTPKSEPPAAAGGKPYLGISGITITPEIANELSLDSNTQGVLIQQIENGGAAAKAGLKASTKQATINGQVLLIGGDIITAINGQSIDSIEGLRDSLIQYKPGDEVTLSVIRDNGPIEVKLTLGERPNQ